MYAGVHPFALSDAGRLSFAVAISTYTTHHVMFTILCILYLKFYQIVDG